MQRVKSWVGRVRAFFAPPVKRPVSWIVGDEPAPEAVRPRLIRDRLGGFFAAWGRIRMRVFRVCAGLLAVVDVALGLLLFSDVWYMNLLLYAFLVPSFLIMVHYLRLTKDADN